MDPEKTLIIYDSINFFKPLINQNGIKCYPSMDEVNSISRIFRKLSLSTGLFKPFWYGSWKKVTKGVDVVVIFATNRVDFIEHLININPDVRVIVWFWNPVFRCFKPFNIKSKGIEFWSFDPEDCKRYNMRFNSTFYFQDIILPQNTIEYDALFLGQDKGRMTYLTALENKLKEASFSTKFHIVNESKDGIVKPIPYSEYLSLISKSRSIVDVQPVGQTGLTLRPMEAIFFKKKLITDNPFIKGQDFYHPNNIFVLNVDDFEKIDEFLRIPYYEIDYSILKRYNFSSWLQRFGDELEF